MTELVLARHGKTKATISRVYCGKTDLPLADEGKDEAKRTAKALSQDKFDFVYSSDMKRAVQTAHIIAPGYEIEYTRTLREMDFGLFEGLTAKQIEQKMPEQWNKYLDDYCSFVFPEGGSVREYFGGAVNTINSIISEHENKKILVVSHKGFIASVLSFYLHGDKTHLFNYDIRPCGFARLFLYEKTAVLGQLY